VSFRNHPLGLPETYAKRLAQRHSDVGFILAQLEREYGDHGLTRNQVAAMRKTIAPRSGPKMLRHVNDDFIRKMDFDEYKAAIKADIDFVGKLNEAMRVVTNAGQFRKRNRTYAPPLAQDIPVGQREIVALIANDMDVSYAELVGSSRQAPIMAARLVAYKVLTERGNSLAQVGRWIGGRDHSTVINGLKKFERNATPWMRELVARWTKQEKAA